MTITAAGIVRTARWLASLLFFAILAASCGGGDDQPVAPTHPPSISNLRYSPASVAPVPGGTVTISGTFDFSDAGGDVSAVRITSSGGADVTTPTPQLSGIASGTAVGQVAVSVDKPGKYTFEVWVTDSTGLSSNKLSGTLEVLPPDSWTRLAVRPPTTLNGIAWNGRYVAVGEGGTVMASTDLANWSAQSIGAGFALAGVAASPSRFVAVGGAAGSAVVTTSTDGSGWSVAYQATVSSTLTKVIWAGNQFVAVGCETRADARQYVLFLTSPDGLAWTPRSTGSFELDPFPPGACGMKSVAWSGSVFVASGIDRSWSPTLWRSSDAVTWV
jgi:hypothetical protein